MKSLADDVVVTCDEIEDTPERASINLSDGINYWLISVVLLSITYLLLLMAIIVKYYMKLGLTIPCIIIVVKR